MNDTSTTKQAAELQSSITTSVAWWSALIGTAIIIAYALMFQYDQNKKVDALKAAGQKSPVHQFVVDKYLGCRAEMFNQSREECVARVMVLARVQGIEYESQTGAAVRDLGLDK